MPTAPRETNHAFHVLAPMDRDSGMRIVGPIGTPDRWCRDARAEPSNPPADSSMASRRCYHQAGFSTTARHREDPMSKASAGVKTSAVFLLCCALRFALGGTPRAPDHRSSAQAPRSREAAAGAAKRAADRARRTATSASTSPPSFVVVLENRLAVSFDKRDADISKYSGVISTPMLLRPHFAAATLVVPVPMNGSSTVSPTKLNMRTSRSASSSGYGAG